MSFRGAWHVRSWKTSAGKLQQMTVSRKAKTEPWDSQTDSGNIKRGVSRRSCIQADQRQMMPWKRSLRKITTAFEKETPRNREMP